MWRFPETTAFQIYGVKTSEKANVRSIAHAPSPAGYIARTRHVNFSPEHALRHVGSVSFDL